MLGFRFAGGSMSRLISAGAWVCALGWFTLPFSINSSLGSQTGPGDVAKLVAEAGVSGGLVVIIGCGDGQILTPFLGRTSFLVQGLDTDPARVAEVRRRVFEAGGYGAVGIAPFDGENLPYVDGLVNLLIVQDPGGLKPEEILRVLCPGGTALIRRNQRWEKLSKPWPPEIDEWTHYLHNPSNNPVANDRVVGPPRRMQWIGGPLYSRHHDRMSSMPAAVTAGGRLFYIIDEASPVSILVPPRWTLVVRDAFNGTILWKRTIEKWHMHLWPLKSGPAQLPRRLVADRDRVYVTLRLDGPVVTLDARTGETLRVYDQTRATEELLIIDGMLLALVNPNMPEPPFVDPAAIKNAYQGPFWDEKPRHVMAVDLESGQTLWSVETTVLPVTLAADRSRVVFHDGEAVVCLDRESGAVRWRSEAVSRAMEIRSFFAPTLVLHEAVILFAGGEMAGGQTGAWYSGGKDTIVALDAQDGRVLWSADHPPSGYRSPEDVIVVDGLVWFGETLSGRAAGVFTGRDPRTGEIRVSFPPDVQTYWFHHRCYRGRATVNYLLMSRTGIEFIDFREKRWLPHHWVRGACLYGFLPANGLLYAPQHPCACYLEAKLAGLCALAPGGFLPPQTAPNLPENRLVRGPAYSEIKPAAIDPEDWPTYRHDGARSGAASTQLASEMEPAWETHLGGRLSAPVAALGMVFVALVDRHTLVAIDQATGQIRWQVTVGGRIDTPPSVVQGRVIFGSADGWIYCLRAEDGELAWRFRAAPAERQLVAFEQLESVWPVPGSVLVHNGVLYAVAGRSMFLDGGLRLVRLDMATGQLLSETVLDENDAEANRTLQDYVSWLNMPPALPDVLSTDGQYLYMRSQAFDLQGKRFPLQSMPRGEDADRGAPPPVQSPQLAHLFSPTGFRDDTWWHRTYWMYGSTFVSGWCGYYLAGKAAPAGRILCFDDRTVYGYGRKPEYYRWTTPLEDQLFATDKTLPEWPNGNLLRRGPTVVRVPKSPSLNPAEKPLTVEAWVFAERPTGVIVAHGGSARGYVLYLVGGRPHWAVRTQGQLAELGGPARITGKWTHLAATLGPDGSMQLYVDGKLVAEGKSPGLLDGNPQEGLEIALDDGSKVGPYSGSYGFTGLIDELRIYHRVLEATEIAAHAAGEPPVRKDTREDSGAVLSFSFDQGQATDQSGCGNHGTVEQALVAEGKLGGALRFAASEVDFLVCYHWTKSIPIYARALLVAGNVLVAAGPPDLLDEEAAWRSIDQPATQELLAEQAAALAGNRGGKLLWIAAESGELLGERSLKSPPVFDGMAAARGQLVICTMDGKVLAFGPKKLTDFANP